MAIRSLAVFLCLCFLQGGLTQILKTPKEPPKWSPLYSVSGVLTIPYAELEEPFYAWYDEQNGKSRIDYYGGMAKTYQLSSLATGGNGVSYKVVPITTEKVYNQQTCLRVNGTDSQKINVQSILPDLEGYEYLGKEVMRETATQKWRLITTKGDKTNKYTIWIRLDIPAGGSSVEAIPVRFEMKGYNILLGSHFDHYYLDYNEYDVSSISPEAFKVDDSLQCRDMDDNGPSHIYTFNPMKEFIHPVTTHHVDHEFEIFKADHKKIYESNREHMKRKEIFRQNLRFIHSLNRANKGFTLAVNRFADISDEEMFAFKGRRYTTNNNGGLPFPYTNVLMKENLPETFDWRIEGAVTPVKDQSVCGSCWTFGTTGALEGAYFLKTGKLTRLSPQALIDCSWGFGNNGCDGGEDFRAYNWVMKHGGIPEEEEYGPYLGQDGYCHIDNVTLVAPIQGFVNVTSGDENALKLALFKHGPISISIDASQKTFSFYSKGVYYDEKCKNKLDELDHSVLAVGYGTLNGDKYWLVKNSWSNLWGNDGYILISAKNNQCGVLTAPTYVIM